MSAPISTPSRSSASDSEEVLAGADELPRAWRAGLRPDPHLTVSEWADKHRWLSSRASAEPGRYRTDRTPYMRAIMDALSPSHPAQRVVFMKAAQVGATETGNSWIGYVIHHAPGPMLAVQPTVELAKRNSRQRIDPLIEESPALRERVRPPRARDSGNTQLSKDFPGGVLVMTGANSAVGLRSMPARLTCSSTRSTPIPPRPTRRATRSRSRRRARSPSRTGGRSTWSRRRRSAGSPGSSGSSRRATRGGSSWPARTAAMNSG